MAKRKDLESDRLLWATRLREFRRIYRELLTAEEELDLAEVVEEIHPSSDHLQGLSKSEVAVFQIIALILPKRLWSEDLGDALEALAGLQKAGAPRWVRGLKVGSLCFWMLVNTVRELVSAVRGNATSASSDRGSKGGRR